MSSSRSPSTSHNSSPARPSSPSTHFPKFHKFLSRHQNRDRARSFPDTGSVTSLPAPPTPTHTPLELPPKSRVLVKKTSRGVKENNGSTSTHDNIDAEEEITNDPPLIIEPEPATSSTSSFALIHRPRQRVRSERPLSTASSATEYLQQFNPPPSPRITDIPSRLSGWFHHTFSSSSTDLPLTAQSLPPSSSLYLSKSLPPSSPRSKLRTASAIMNHLPGKANLERAVRYLLDSDIAQPDKCTEKIWLLGVEHPGYEAPMLAIEDASNLSADALSHFSQSSNTVQYGPEPQARRSTTPSSTLSRSSQSPQSNYQLSQQSLSNSISKQASQPLGWPPAFYADFSSRIWLTYRSQYQPIRDITLLSLNENPGWETQAPSPQKSNKWSWPVGGEKGWTSDTGWGCMLRTGQSLLANALIHLHLSRDWRRPPYPAMTSEYAMYVRILTWFFDSPSPLCPFGVHRMALAGKDLGKDVGSWFGPSTAAGAIRTLVHAYPPAYLSVAIASDGVLFESDVYTASHMNNSPPTNGRTQPGLPMSPSVGSAAGSYKSRAGSSRRSLGGRSRRWGDRAVLVLIGVRLGIDGVNPVYYESIKTLFTFPQCAGIAGGRPSSSYYFVGSQENSLFYLDPHHTRPAVPLRPPPSPSADSENEATTTEEDSHNSTTHRGKASSGSRRQSMADARERDWENQTHHRRTPTSPVSPRSSIYSVPAPSSPTGPKTPSGPRTSTHHHQISSASAPAHSQGSSSSSPPPSILRSDPLTHHYATAYSPMELKTFHCERVRKMPLSGLDPSMLLGFLCKDEEDWKDFRLRITLLAKSAKSMFYIQDEPPNWPDGSDDDLGLESVSEPDLDLDDFLEDEDEEGEKDKEEESRAAVDNDEEDEEDMSDYEAVTPGPRTHPTFPDAVQGPNHILPPPDQDEESDDGSEEWINPTPPPPGGSYIVSQRRRTKSPESSRHSSPAHGTSPPSPPPRESTRGQHYPFPVAPGNEAEGKKIPVLRSVRGKNGGRTKSGGVKGVPWPKDGEGGEAY
ncbi:hypothetical protein BOTBODRAFT_53103 [Botryobasidium botryosum FD-172 SS1]|uniref:Autophagy-related protein 4 n=1 Tax=Botryobasidium botryosum (strain FD-172 SS1) TaxID=930990 RepID=A0A067MPL9_BOTB1|nr:hypothetical protein BOTBODRAFT_53103 [Botryobasidium botryosum FD-172 SS1]